MTGEISTRPPVMLKYHGAALLIEKNGDKAKGYFRKIIRYIN